MVHETGAHSTDVEQEEPVEHLCGKCVDYAKDWQETADKLWLHIHISRRDTQTSKRNNSHKIKISDRIPGLHAGNFVVL